MRKPRFLNEDDIDRRFFCDFCDFGERLFDMNPRKPECTRSILFERSLQLNSGRPICFHTGGVFVALPLHYRDDLFEDDDDGEYEY